MKNLAMIIPLALCLLPMNVYADSAPERASLSRLNEEISLLNIVIKEAQAQSESNPYHRFNYTKLRSDLEKVRQGIDAHLNEEDRHPKEFEPIGGEYAEYVN